MVGHKVWRSSKEKTESIEKLDQNKTTENHQKYIIKRKITPNTKKKKKIIPQQGAEGKFQEKRH